MDNKERINFQIRTRIIFHRKKKGMTQNDVADAIGMKRTTYSYYESKATKYTPEFLKSVAEAIGISPNVFKIDATYDRDIDFVIFENEHAKVPEPFTATGNEQKLVKLYRMLSDEEKSNIFNLLLDKLKIEENNK
ncbi:MAG: helix-turn-helix domain-containing protein [Ruminococcaceae bacterium]|nr:helix-turn-helix domain-containing protein [Oscillospiraceae bacterium]